MLDVLNDLEWLGNSASHWIAVITAALLGFLIARTVLMAIRSHFRRIDAQRPAAAQRTARPLRTVVEATRNWILALLAIVLAARFLDISPRIETMLGSATFTLVGLQIALWVNALIELWSSRADPADDQTSVNPVIAGVLRWSTQLVVWTVLLLAMLSNAGVDITAFVASLGIGGVAVALGLQSLLGDLFSSISIGLDKPFEVGEFIAFGEVLGTVRNVGIKSTRIGSLRGEELVISNSNLLNQLVHNYGRMPHRRIVFGFHLPYGTTSEQVRTILDATIEIIRGTDQSRFDRGHLAAFGEYGLEFEFVYYVLSSDYTLYRDIQQRINLGILDLLAEHGVEFAIPARQIFVDAARTQAIGLHPATSDPSAAAQA